MLRFVCCCLPLALAACFSWRPMAGGVVPGQARSLPYRLRVTRADSSQVVLTAPFLRADTLYGRTVSDTIGIALSGVRGLERERLSVARTLGAAVGAPVAVVGIFFLVQCGGGDCKPSY